MGVYDHMMRPSMGHRMQVELRDSMRRYHQDKTQLQQQYSQLRFDKRDLHTSPLPPTPPPPSIKRWSDKGSKFNKAPELAAEKARLAKLEREINQQNADTQGKGKNTPLPPIHGSKQDSDNDQATPRSASPTKPTTEDQTPSKKSDAKDSDAKGAQKTPATKKVVTKKFGKKFGKKGKLRKAGQKNIPLHLRLPIIHSASLRDRTMWDSGCNHIHPKTKATVLEKNQVEEDCRNFTQRSHDIPNNYDPKRSEIRKAPRVKQSGEAAVVKFTFRQAARNDPEAEESNHAEDQTSNSLVKDHFPKNTPRLPELEDSGTEDSDNEDDADIKTADDDQFQLPRLPVIRAYDTKASPQGFHQTASNVPRLPRGITPSAISTATGRSGATGATYMSQETQEWKGEYMTSDNAGQKSRMLVDILHAVRQRMHDNEEDLRLSGNDPRPRDKLSKEGRSDIMLVHRNITPSSGATTARSTGPQKLMKLPHQKKTAGSLSQSQNSRLHRYLNKLSNQRRGLDHRHANAGASFQLASMTIREITQSSIEHHSTVRTAHTAQTAN